MLSSVNLAGPLTPATVAVPTNAEPSNEPDGSLTSTVGTAGAMLKLAEAVATPIIGGAGEGGEYRVNAGREQHRAERHPAGRGPGVVAQREARPLREWDPTRPRVRPPRRTHVEQAGHRCRPHRPRQPSAWPGRWWSPASTGRRSSRRCRRNPPPPCSSPRRSVQPGVPTSPRAVTRCGGARRNSSAMARHPRGWALVCCPRSDTTPATMAEGAERCPTVRARGIGHADRARSRRGQVETGQPGGGGSAGTARRTPPAPCNRPGGRSPGEGGQAR